MLTCLCLGSCGRAVRALGNEPCTGFICSRPLLSRCAGARIVGLRPVRCCGLGITLSFSYFLITLYQK